MGLIKTILPLIIAAFALLVCSDALTASSESNKSPMAHSGIAASWNNRLRRTLKTIDARDDISEQSEERGVPLKNIRAKIPFTKTHTEASNAKKAAEKLATAKHLDELKTAMLKGDLPTFHNSPFAKFFLAGKQADDVVRSMKTAGKRKSEYNHFKKGYKKWLSDLLKANKS
ncbi:hypothetical protein PHYPSEUDO_008538 [Phytophthora pseudosyringae]|uniref:RxLR effector protein n=1 Tax=Phytophthora pseudosyringae TaxID=221518 RepID=A0A8T1VJ56_9STRA|nr:hypothetical protein PHYPSEUDO_008538 [Phytophthora pseudosyringae]